MAQRKNDCDGIVAAEPIDGSAEPIIIVSRAEDEVGELDGIPIAEPTESIGATASVGGSTAKRGRGRPAGSGKSRRSGAKEKAAPVSVKGIEKILFSMHAMASAALKIDELSIDQEEAKLLAEAVTEVASHYNTTIDPKVLAWMGLMGVCGQLYGPRFAAYKLRKTFSERPQKNSPVSTSASEIVPMGDGTFASVVQH